MTAAQFVTQTDVSESNIQSKSIKPATKLRQKPSAHSEPTKSTETPKSQHQKPDWERIDLTNDVESTAAPKFKPRNVIKQSTLIIGSSLLKNIKVNDLNKSTAVRTFSGATIETIQSKMAQLNLDKCQTVFLLVGSNDADNGTSLETFTEKYEELLTISWNAISMLLFQAIAKRNC